MWLVFARTPLPDAPYWPGRRLLALVDATAWPVIWIVLAIQVSAGIVVPVVVGLAAICAVGRVHRAAWQNHRYHFTTWQWGRAVARALLIGVVLAVLSTG